MSMFDRTVSIHLRGVFLGIRAAARVMRTQGRGSIINTASVAALGANYAGHDYSACKAAIAQLTRTTANELGRTGCPGQRHLPGRRRHVHLRPGRRARRRTGPGHGRGHVPGSRRPGADPSCGPARRHRRGRPVAGRRRIELRHRPGHRRRRRPHHRVALPGGHAKVEALVRVPGVPGLLTGPPAVRRPPGSGWSGQSLREEIDQQRATAGPWVKTPEWLASAISSNRAPGMAAAASRARAGGESTSCSNARPGTERRSPATPGCAPGRGTRPGTPRTGPVGPDWATVRGRRSGPASRPPRRRPAGRCWEGSAGSRWRRTAGAADSPAGPGRARRW